MPGLPLERQEAMLRDAGIDLGNAYIDRLSVAKRRKRDPGDLTARAVMLRLTSHHARDTIYVAGLRVLGWSMADICRVLNAAGRRNTAVHAVDIGKTFIASALESEILEALADAEDARRRGQTADARVVAVRSLRGRNIKATDAKMKRARELWPKLREASVADICREVGLSAGTLYKRLGPRETFVARRKKQHA